MANEVLLIQDVEHLGRKGDIVRARGGYIRNYLIPKQYAVVATKAALKHQAKLQEERQQQAVEDRRDAEAAAAQLETIVLKAIVKVDPDGHMYGSVSNVDIINMLKEQADLEIDRRSVQLKAPIKTTGVHILSFKLKEGVTAALKLKVLAEGTVDEEEEAVAEVQE
jgi:large subunit ribosomal protein L9